MKTERERLIEVTEIRKKFKSLDLSSEIPEINEMIVILKNYIKDGEYKFGYINSHTIHKKIIFHLKPKKNKISEVIFRNL